MLFVSFWHMASKNLPEGAFCKRRLAIDEVRVLVTRARQEGKLFCVAKTDLAAPHEETARQRHAELCQALNRLSIPISINDFFSEVCCNALQFAYVGKGSDLLFIESCYAFADGADAVSAQRDSDQFRDASKTWSSQLTIDPSTITFDLYSLLDVEIIR